MLARSPSRSPIVRPGGFYETAPNDDPVPSVMRGLTRHRR